MPAKALKRKLEDEEPEQFGLKNEGRLQVQCENNYSKQDFWRNFNNLEEKQWKDLMNLTYGTSNVVYIYNPLEYAREPHENYLRLYCNGFKKVLLLGMNPGPWGMCQTGVPFGEINNVKTWLNITGEVKKPHKEHEQRLIEGFNCQRTEVSGDRMWKLLRELSKEPKILFKNIFLHNYCPLAFLSKTGKNITPTELKAKERKPLEDVCDKALVEAVKMLQIKHLVCIGNYVLQRSQKALQAEGITDIQVSVLMHPSPVNPKANKGWKEIAVKQLKEAEVLHYFTEA